VLCTIVKSTGSTPRHSNSKMIVFPDGHIEGTIGGGELEKRVIAESLAAFKDGNSRLIKYDYIDPTKGDVGVCGGSVEVFMEPILSQPTLIVIGSGHVGKALAHLANWLNFRVVIADDREEFCSPDFIPDANERICAPAYQIPGKLTTSEHSYIVLTTRGNDLDIEMLPELLTKKWYYLGIIGSIRRWKATQKALLEKGIDQAALDKVHSPIGLELNAETPEEIAVSIMAEIIMLRNHGTGKAMQSK